MPSPDDPVVQSPGWPSRPPRRAKDGRRESGWQRSRRSKEGRCVPAGSEARGIGSGFASGYWPSGLGSSGCSREGLARLRGVGFRGRRRGPPMVRSGRRTHRRRTRSDSRQGRRRSGAAGSAAEATSSRTRSARGGKSSSCSAAAAAATIAGHIGWRPASCRGSGDPCLDRGRSALRLPPAAPRPSVEAVPPARAARDTFVRWSKAAIRPGPIPFRPRRAGLAGSPISPSAGTRAS